MLAGGLTWKVPEENTSRWYSQLSGCVEAPNSQKSHLLFHQCWWEVGPVVGIIFEVFEEGRDLLLQVTLGKECRSSVKGPGPPAWASSLCRHERVLA